jgi:hypothetical protein
MVTGKEASFLQQRSSLISARLKALKSSPCSGHLPAKNPRHAEVLCPEIFLDVVSTKLTSTAVLFLNVELLSEFFYQFPRELDVRLGRGLSREEVERFAREDERVRRHLDVIRRKEGLELVLERVRGLRELEAEEKRGQRGKRDGRERKREEKKSWGGFFGS